MGPINSYEFPSPFATVQNDFTLMAWCWTVVAPLLMHWSCCSLALPGLRLDVHYDLCWSCKNYAYHWRVSFLFFNELMLPDYSAISHWFCIYLCVTVAIKTFWILKKKIHLPITQVSVSGASVTRFVLLHFLQLFHKTGGMISPPVAPFTNID